MELSPEERQRIYLEEKARLEARQQLLQEGAKPKKARRFKFWWLLLLFFGLIILASILDERSKPKPATQSPEQVAAEAKATNQQFEDCKAKLEKAKELDLLYDIGARGASVHVLVGPTYFTVPIDAKQGFAATVNCVLMKGTGGGMPFDLIHWQTGKKVASWNGYKLNVD
jgi:hypothetical protein